MALVLPLITTEEYGFTDVDGSIPDAEKLHASLLQNAPEYWEGVVGSSKDDA